MSGNFDTNRLASVSQTDRGFFGDMQMTSNKSDRQIVSDRSDNEEMTKDKQQKEPVSAGLSASQKSALSLLGNAFDFQKDIVLRA